MSSWRFSSSAVARRTTRAACFRGFLTDGTAKRGDLAEKLPVRSVDDDGLSVVQFELAGTAGHRRQIGIDHHRHPILHARHHGALHEL